MKPELIVMLTHNDVTVSNAIELFEQSKHLPVQHWGFKDVGLPPEQMKDLVRRMKEAGKVTYLEVVSLSEAEGLRGAQIAVEAGFDILMGTVYFDSIHQYLKDKPVKYYPFPGHVHSHPSILDGTIEEIVRHAQQLEAKGVDGMDLLAYRYVGDARQLLKEVVAATHVPIVSAGSVASFQRIAEIWEAGAWGFTIGSAFFEGKFVPGGDFTQNIKAVSNWLANTAESEVTKYL
ncbi:MAG: 4-hydroxythreonine-4-phosphate dehydrogenase [Anaerolineae bacterium]|nr:MAG: 4-hydroxythreonine-4-phosphate dehydrogenase [Anaerolineae bacterium]